MQQALAAEPGNQQVRLLYAQALLVLGNDEGAKAQLLAGKAHKAHKALDLLDM